MAKDSPKKEPKSSRQILFPFLVGMGALFASWFYWPNFEVLFISRYFKAFNGAISPMFVLALYLFVVLLVVFDIARLLKKFSIFMGAFLPVIIFLGICEWNSYEKTLKYIDALELLSLLFDLFSKKS
jgi:hypothetical protein